MPIPFGPILIFKEISDFIQIGLVSWQTGKRFQQQRAVRGGTVGIDGGTVTVTIGTVRTVMPIEDAAALAGVGGAGGRGQKPSVRGTFQQIIESPFGLVTGAGLARRLADVVVRPSRPQAGQDTTTGAPAPDADAKPFTLREFITLQELGKTKRGEAIRASEVELLALQQDQNNRLALLDAQIARERIAAQVDITRMQIVARLEEQRRELVSRFALQERELASRLQLQRERLDAEATAQERRFGLQEGLNEAERAWKTSERQADLAWRERTQKEQSDLAEYRRNLNADLAVGRAVDAAVKLGEALKRAGLAPAGLVSFAQAFAKR